MTHYISLLNSHTLDQLKQDVLFLESDWPLDAAKVYNTIAERCEQSLEKMYYFDLAKHFEMVAKSRLS